MIIGYTTGAFDLFHIGHLNVLRNAKSMCDELIVGVSTDELVMEYKNKKPLIPLDERIDIVRSIKYVNSVIVQQDMDKMGMWKQLKFDLIFVGDDWRGTDKWNKFERDFDTVGVKLIYLPYTKSTSSTMITKFLNDSTEPLTGTTS